MNFEVTDSKLKTLIQLCKKNNNYRRISIVFFNLLNNLIDQIGPKLAIRIRNDNKKEKKKEKLFEYMEYINKKYNQDLNVRIFKPNIIESVMRIEDLYRRNNCILPHNILKELITVYYDLRSLKFPDFNKLIKGNKLVNISELDTFHILFHENEGKFSGSNNNIGTLVLQKKMEQSELELQKRLRREYNPDDLEQLLYLKKISNTLNSTNNGKILLQGKLKDDIMYNLSKKEIANYFILGLAVCSLSMAVLILIEMNQFLSAMNGLTPFLIIPIFLSIILLYTFNKLSKKRGI
ncbi:MAG: hypothetical protein ACFFDH_05435 [Promethearchaeota archaeon]